MPMACILDKHKKMQKTMICTKYELFCNALSTSFIEYLEQENGKSFLIEMQRDHGYL